jgi:hypothetical protein
VIVSSTVEATWDPLAIREMVDGRAATAVTAAAAVGGQTAASVARQRVKTGQMSRIAVYRARRTPSGFVASFASGVKHAWHQNDGTLANRRPEKPRRTPAGDRDRRPGTGVKPLFFLDAGLLTGRRELLRRTFGGGLFE